nr:RNA polymerase II degradation factor 1-like [Aedes albopictus]XP_029713365.1 RNA polymerase II degradation factor 1-like [Aedes albopictus]
MKLFVLCLFLGAVAAEAPFAGYAPSGWRPQGAQFRLPTEYGAPVVEQKQEVEVTKEKVAFAAQVVETSVETTTEQLLSNEYLPPATTTEQPELDPIRVQGLPQSQFRDFQKQPQPSFAVNGQLRVSPSSNFKFGRQEQAQPAAAYGVPEQDANDSDAQDLPENQQIPQQLPLFPQNGRLRATQNQNFQFGRQEQAQPAQTYGVPDQHDNDSNNPEEQYPDPRQASGANQAPQQPIFAFNGQLRAFPANQFKFGRQEQAQPTQTYGTPGDKDAEESGSEDLPEEPEPTDAPSSDSDNSVNQDPNGDGRTVIAVANSFAGQYYVLGPDNNLQRVMYATSQSDDDRRNMGFTAQLRYSQVEPIRGPVYAYNEQGQLVRIYKK